MRTTRAAKRGLMADQVVHILERQRAAVLGCLMKQLKISMEDAVDLMYTTLAELVLRFRLCSWPKSIRNWGAYLLTTAVHAFLRPATGDARLLSFYPPVADENDLHPYAAAPGTTGSPAQLAERAELVARVRSAIAKLDVLRQTAVLLWSAGFSGVEIARTLSLSPTHARVLKHQALKALRITLKEIA